MQLTLPCLVGDAVAIRWVEEQQAHAACFNDRIMNVGMQYTVDQLLGMPGPFRIQLDAEGLDRGS